MLLLQNVKKEQHIDEFILLRAYLPARTKQEKWKTTTQATKSGNFIFLYAEDRSSATEKQTLKTSYMM